MKALFTSILVVMAALLLAAPASAEVLFDGSGDPADVGYSLAKSAASSVAIDSPTGNLTITSNKADYALYTLSSSSAAAELDNSAGWSVEVRLEVVDQPSDAYAGHGFKFHDDVVSFALFVDQPGVGTGGFDMRVADDGDLDAQDVTGLSTGYHTVRLVVPAGGTKVTWYVDGSLQGDVDLTTSSFTPDFWFGDGGGSTGGTLHLDYLNINPIPEPSTLVLLASGLLGLVCYAWRKRR